jgi:hypothetical protein
MEKWVYSYNGETFASEIYDTKDQCIAYAKDNNDEDDGIWVGQIKETKFSDLITEQDVVEWMQEKATDVLFSKTGLDQAEVEIPDTLLEPIKNLILVMNPHVYLSCMEMENIEQVK